jgi:aminoglycoside phosphotransferase (APT) family kinase protein
MRYGERIVSIESRAPGRPLVLACSDWGVPLRRKVRYLQLAAEWLIRFHLQTLIRREPWDGREVAGAFAAFRDRFGASAEEEALFDFALGLSRELAGVPFPIIWQHRDFTPWNLLVDSDRLTVLDWEGAQPGLALCDLLHFVSHWNELAPLGAPASRRQVTRYCEALGIDPRFIPLLRVYTRVEIALRSQVRTRDADYVTALAEELRRAA